MIDVPPCLRRSSARPDASTFSWGPRSAAGSDSDFTTPSMGITEYKSSSKIRCRLRHQLRWLRQPHPCLWLCSFAGDIESDRAETGSLEIFVGGSTAPGHGWPNSSTRGRKGVPWGSEHLHQQQPIPFQCKTWNMSKRHYSKSLARLLISFGSLASVDRA